MAEEKKQMTEAVKDGQPKRKPAGQLIAELRKENEDLRKDLAASTALVDGLRKKARDKESLVYRTEQECDDKVANKDLVIRGLRSTIENLNKENARLCAEVRQLNDIIAELRKRSERKGLLAKIFGK